MIESVIQQMTDSVVCLFISDCIVDLPVNDDSQKFLGRCRISIKNAINEGRSKIPDLGVEILKLESDFSGKYFYPNGQVEVLDGVKRPYYIWIFGNSNILANLNNQVPLSGLEKYGLEGVVAFAREVNVPYKITNVWRTSNVINPNNGDYTMTLRADFSATLQPEATIQSPSNYSMVIPGLKIESIQPISDKNSPYSHYINIMIPKGTKIAQDKLTFNSPALPSWVDNSNDETGKAEEFIHEKLSTTPKKRKKKIWSAILCGFFLLSALGTIMRTCGQAMVQSSEAPSKKLGAYQPTDNWSNYEISGAFTISIPKTMELRNDYDQYTQVLRNKGIALSSADAVFQQADLSKLSSDAYDTYSRVLIGHYTFSPGEVERHNEAPYIDMESRKNLREVVDVELGGWSYIEYPDFGWIDIDGTKAIEAKYKRTGVEGPVVCRIYLLPNYDEMVKIVVAYRESDATKWSKDLCNVIRTFHWKNPK